MAKVTEFQRKTYNKMIDRVSSFIPDEGGITTDDLITIIRHCVETTPNNELDALFDISSEPIKGVKRSKLFNRDKKEVAVGLALLKNILDGLDEEGEDEQK